MSYSDRELSDLLGALCDQRLSEGDCARLEALVLADRDALRYYLRYVELHGLLHWDAAGGTVQLPAEMEAVTVVAAPCEHPRRRHWMRWAVAAAAACVVAVIGVQRLSRPTTVESTLSGARISAATDDNVTSPAVAQSEVPRPTGPVRLSTNSPSPAVAAAAPPRPTTPDNTATTAAPVLDAPNHSSESMVAVIDRELRAYWNDHEVVPARRADDAAWVRRVHLDLVGRIPEADTVVSFLADSRADKRAQLVDDLLSSPEFARHYSVVWTNLLIGHTAPREVNRPALEKFLREQFHRNRSWSDTVTQLVAAEGYEDENGATNFLLAHVNNEAVPATAVTARVLLCEQVQCTQCHNHPFVDWKQDRFWQLNAFFQQTEIIRHQPVDSAPGQPDRDRLELVSLETGGPTYFEDHLSRMSVAYPQFENVVVDAAPSVNRREELAKLLCDGDRPQIARAFVNRTWGKFFGYGFTDPIDDMGPHNQPVLPELLDALTAEFVRSGFNVKQLVRWIVLSEPYQLGHEPAEGVVDDPALGQPPLFSRMYVRPLSAEQLFDSLLTATQADRAGARYWDEIEARRREWLEQFYTALDNDENSEEDAFEGSLEQTLVMMNGDLIRQATGSTAGTVLQQIVSRDGSEEEKIRLLSLATLSREPTPAETATLRKLIRQQVQSRPRDVAPQTALQEGFRDLMWAYLNSTEFRSIF